MLSFLLLMSAGCGSLEAPDPSDEVTSLEPLPFVELGRVEHELRARIESLRGDFEADRFKPGADAGSQAELWGELGNLLHICELLDAAATAYGNAERLVPEDIRWPYYLGMVHQTLGQLPAAAANLEKVAQLAREDLPARLRLGEVRLQLNRPDAARESFDQALALAPDSAAVSYGLGRLAAVGGEARKAVAHFERALELQPEASEIHYQLAQQHRKLGDQESALAHLELRGARGVRFADPLADRLSETKTLTAFAAVSELAGDAVELADKDFFGFALEQVGAVEGAAQHLEDLLAAGPRVAPEDGILRWRARMLYVIGGLEARSGADAGAEESLREALALAPTLLDAGRRLGNVLARSGRFDEAVAVYSQVLETMPFDREVLLKRATAFIELERLDAASADLEKLVEADPKDGMAHLRLGTVLGRRGDWLAARNALERSLAAELPAKERALAHRQLGKLLTKSGERAEALSHFRAVVTLEPERLPARLDLAGTLARLKRYGEALVEYDRVLMIDARHLGAQVDRARALIQLGRYWEALEQLEASVARWRRRAEPSRLLAHLLATCPDDSLRDGRRALRLSGTLFRADQSTANAEVMAMALAEVGRFDEAAALQRRILSEEEALDTPRRQQRANTLARYRRGLPARLP